MQHRSTGGPIPLLTRHILPLTICAILASGAHAGEQEISKTFRYSTSAKLDTAGIVRALYNPGGRPVQGPAETVAREFLEQNRAALGITELSSSIEPVATLRVPGGAHVYYRQVFAGIPVSRGDIVVSTRDDGTVSMVVNNYRSGIGLRTTVPTLSPADALQRARASLNARSRPTGLPETTTLVVYPTDAGTYRLAYRVRTMCLEPYGDWELHIDAMDGSVLAREDRFVLHHEGSRSRGSGMVYLSDPLSAAHQMYGSKGFVDNNDTDTDSLAIYRSLVPLDSLSYENGLYRLEGPAVTVTDIEPPDDPLFASPSPDGFRFTRSDPGFEAVMCYYHISTAYQRLNELGFQIPSLGELRADPHGFLGKDNSHYSPCGNWLSFGTGGVDDAEDADVIWHEYGHAIIYNLIPDWGGGESGSLGEGFGDYWAGSYSRSLGQWETADPQYNWLFNWDGHNEYWGGRILDDQHTYPFGSLSVHMAGQIWSSALMGILGDLGRDITDRLVIKSLYYLGSSPSAVDNAMAILQADRDLYGGRHLSTLTYWLGTIKRFLPADTQNLILVVNDEAPASAIASESGRKGFNSVISAGEWKTSGSVFYEAAAPAGYSLQSTSFAGLDTARLSAFKAVVLVAGLNTTPFNDPAKRAAIVRYVRSGGRVLVEGGEVGYRYREDPGGEADLDFRTTVLHVSSFVNDATEADLLSRSPSIPFFQTPHPLAGAIHIAARTTYSDRDAMRPIVADKGTIVLATWSGITTAAGVIAHFDGSDSLRTIFLPFAVSSLADSAAGQALVENALLYLLDPATVIPALPDLPTGLPESFALNQNFPNPFNPRTTITYALPDAAPVQLVVYDLLGRVVLTLVEEWQDAGEHAVTFDAVGAASGVYFYRLKAGDFTATKRMVVLK